MKHVEVDTVWLCAVRDVLFAISHQDSELGKLAECLGQSIPAMLQLAEKEIDNKTILIKRIRGWVEKEQKLYYEASGPNAFADGYNEALGTVTQNLLKKLDKGY